MIKKIKVKKFAKAVEVRNAKGLRTADTFFN